MTEVSRDRPPHTGSELADLSGIGTQLAARLKALGLVREIDLLLHQPLRYEDRTRLTRLDRIRPGELVQVEGRIAHSEIRRARKRMLIAVLADDHGQILLRFFHFFPSQQKLLSAGNRVRCYGEVRFGREGFELIHPQCQHIDDRGRPALPTRLSPIYPTTAGLAQYRLGRLIADALARAASEQWPLPDPLGAWKDFPDLLNALVEMHQPSPDADLAALIDGHHPAIRRLAIEELLAHHLALARVNQARERQRASRLKDKNQLRKRLLKGLPFKPTAAQTRVSAEIAADLAAERPMRRLLQGDVGSGKTLVAALAMLTAVGAGRQAALVAPTEILAEQHYRTFSDWFEPLGIEPVWLAGKVKGKARTAVLKALAEGAPVAIGTHALFQSGVSFSDLALVVVDEQHRFGVHQRLALADKGRQGEHLPHQLVMTATPIPRTLAMTAYAGLDVSIIDELPPGRQPVTTVVMGEDKRERLIERIRVALKDGRQAYWVCPLIAESEQLEAEAAETTSETLKAQLPDFRIGLIHGRMKPAEKQEVMSEFVSGRIRLLVATTVIEVGVDVPNASLMIIENAERLGLSQLHQLRGRVGRGSDQSACVLLYKPPLGEIAKARLEVMRSTTDGFVIAEKDLELRGPGEVLGTRQTGMLRFRIADLARDADCFDQVKELAGRIDRPGADVLIERWIGPAEAFVEV